MLSDDGDKPQRRRRNKSDMSEFYVKRRVERTRKEHRCYDCGKRIPVGSTCTDSATSIDFQFLHGYFCSDCVEVPEKVLPQAIVRQNQLNEVEAEG